MDNQQHQPSVNGGPPANPHMQQQVVSNDANANSKRTALAGQWRTPPMPTFPSSAQAAAPKPPGAVAPPRQQQAAQQKKVDISQMPDSTEDYAKALQEAYRRGAEAAQAMAAAAAASPQPAAPVRQTTTATTQILPSSSCPNFQKGAVVPQPVNVAKPAVKVKQTPPPPQLIPSAPPPIMAAPAPIQAAVPNPLSMPPPTSMNPIAPTTQSSVPVTITNPMGHNVVPHPHQTPMTGMVKPGVMAQQVVPPQAQRSMSLPDMSSYAAQQEEEKRQKRLARNRASARLRRLRKKNLVEAYEQEVGILEKTLAQLQAHEWGETDNVGALTEALSMDRGQQVLTFKQRHEAAASLLDQQLQWIEMLEEIMMEDYVLQNVRSGEFAELRDILGLEEEQLNQIEASKVGWEEEWAALQTLKASVTAMRENDWLWNESVSSISEQFMGILHKNQVSKFLLWADHNAEAIDELDGVNAYPGTPNGPVFAFGVENQPGENFGDEEK
mmetsp:Transcript_14308/g.29669  ORF Transcript_14308/g.29669 Transcript_14308/m.29669 type:complete len:497 (-) Transcript_14308:287-1777(-)